MGEDHPRIDVTVDVVALADRDGVPHVLLVRRGNPPFADEWALPGGYLEIEEQLASGAARELHEETGIVFGPDALCPLGAYGEPGRDPRNRTISVAFLAELDEAVEPRGGDDAADARWHPVPDIAEEQLAFDHATILRDAVASSRWASWTASSHADPG